MGYRYSGQWCVLTAQPVTDAVTKRYVQFSSFLRLRCGMPMAASLQRKLPVLEGVTCFCYVRAHFDFRHVRKLFAMLKCGINIHFNAIFVITFRSMHLLFGVANRKSMWISARRPRKFISIAFQWRKVQNYSGTACTHN